MGALSCELDGNWALSLSYMEMGAISCELDGNGCTEL